MKSCLIVGGILLGVFIILGVVIGYLIVNHPEKILGFLRRFTPTYYPAALAVEEGNSVHVLFLRTPIVPNIAKNDEETDLKWDTDPFHITLADESWTSHSPIELFSDAVQFNDTLWLLHDDGAQVWSNGQWSDTVTNTGWINPHGCVVGPRLWVFCRTEDDILTATTTTDGQHWKHTGLQQQLPPAGPDEEEAEELFEMLFGRLRVVARGNVPYVFWHDPQLEKICFRFYDGQWSPVHSRKGSPLFAVTTVGEVLYLFDVPAVTNNQPGNQDDMRVVMRTFNGQRWSEPENLGVKTLLCLDASTVGGDIWLFTSGYKSLSYTVYRQGTWGDTEKIPTQKK